MNHSVSNLLLVLFLVLTSLAEAFSPTPTSITEGNGEFQFTDSTRIFYETRVANRTIESSLQPLAEVFAGECEILTGIKPTVVAKTSSSLPAAGDISLEFDAVSGSLVSTEEEEDQSYELLVSDSVTISSSYFKGVAYGTVTFLQALEEGNESFSVPQMTIADAPAAAYRTLMIDVARKPSGVGMLKEVVRLARQYKIRYVQLHLTDDQHFTFPFEPITDNLSNNFTYGRSELIDLVQYADARGVTLIPELDLPGHSSRLRQSGYLNPSANDADVADPANFSRIEAIVDDMLSVFVNSPYFHIGGDESQAGSALVPFLANINNHLRGSPEGGKRRMLVWEGFHGAPVSSLPATGDDRVIVLSWESSYNTPWDLLNSNYEIVNASWKPLYVVGDRSGPRWPHSLQRMWSPEVIHTWDKDTFMHWEPGRPVFEDAGPADPVDDDGIWNANWIGKQAQVIGGQMLSWEQNEKSIVGDLLPRLPVMADRLWNPISGEDFTAFQGRLDGVKEKALAIVRPIEILPLAEDQEAFLTNPDYRSYSGNSVNVELRNRTRIAGTIRYEVGGSNNSLSGLDFSVIPETTSSSAAYTSPFSQSGGFGVRAALYRGDNGQLVDGHDYQFFSNIEDRVRVTSYHVPRRPLGSVPDLAGYPESEVKAVYQLPILHGPYIHKECVGQTHDAVLTIPGNGDYTFDLATRSGRGTFYLDLNKNGLWEGNEIIIAETTPDEARKENTVALTAGEYRFRLDHVTDPIGATILLSIEGPGTGGKKGVHDFLSLPPEAQSPPVEPQPLEPVNGAAAFSPGKPLRWTSNGATTYQVFLWLSSNPEPAQPSAVVSGSSYDHGGLNASSEYSWKVISTNSEGSNTSPVWTFSTGIYPDLSALLLHEEFDGYNPGSVIGQAGQGTGLAGNWSNGGNAGSFTIGAGLSGSNGLVVVADGTGDLDAKVSHEIEDWGSGVFYMSYLWNEASYGGHAYVSAGGSWAGAFGHAWTQSWGINNAGEGVNYSPNQSYRLVAKIDFENGVTTMWADPSSESDTPVATKNEVQATSPRELILRYYGTDGTIDDIRISRDFGAVSNTFSDLIIELVDFEFQGSQGLLTFQSDSGISDWKILASSTLASFDIDETARVSISEVQAGIYEVSFDRALFPAKYFFKIVR